MSEQARYIREMAEVEGIYLATDSSAPGCYVVIVSIGGTLLAMAPTHELKPDGFTPTATFQALATFLKR